MGRVDYVKGGPDDLLVRIGVTNAGPEPASLHVLPTAWFRNTWAWGDDVDVAARPILAAVRGSGQPPGPPEAPPAWARVSAAHPFVGDRDLLAAPGPAAHPPALLSSHTQ